MSNHFNPSTATKAQLISAHAEMVQMLMASDYVDACGLSNDLLVIEAQLQARFGVVLTHPTYSQLFGLSSNSTVIAATAPVAANADDDMPF